MADNETPETATAWEGNAARKLRVWAAAEAAAMGTTEGQAEAVAKALGVLEQGGIEVTPAIRSAVWRAARASRGRS